MVNGYQHGHGRDRIPLASNAAACLSSAISHCGVQSRARVVAAKASECISELDPIFLLILPSNQMHCIAAHPRYTILQSLSTQILGEALTLDVRNIARTAFGDGR